MRSPEHDAADGNLPAPNIVHILHSSVESSDIAKVKAIFNAALMRHATLMHRLHNEEGTLCHRPHDAVDSTRESLKAWILGNYLKMQGSYHTFSFLHPYTSHDVDISIAADEDPANPIFYHTFEISGNIFQDQSALEPTRQNIIEKARGAQNAPISNLSTSQDVLAAADALSALISETDGIEDSDARYIELLGTLPQFFAAHGTDALYEFQSAIRGTAVDEPTRALLLEAVSHLQFDRIEHANYVDFIVIEALRDPSHFVRSAAVTAMLARKLAPKELRAAASEEMIDRLRARMERVAGKLEARRVGSASP